MWAYVMKEVNFEIEILRLLLHFFGKIDLYNENREVSSTDNWCMNKKVGIMISNPANSENHWFLKMFGLIKIFNRNLVL